MQPTQTLRPGKILFSYLPVSLPPKQQYSWLPALRIGQEAAIIPRLVGIGADHQGANGRDRIVTALSRNQGIFTRMNRMNRIKPKSFQ
jgi:hypothetical protein